MRTHGGLSTTLDQRCRMFNYSEKCLTKRQFRSSKRCTPGAPHSLATARAEQANLSKGDKGRHGDSWRNVIRWNRGDRIKSHRSRFGPTRAATRVQGDAALGQKRDKLGDKRMINGEYSHGSLPMNCGPGLCWEGGGLGVPTSLFLAILVLALANSSLRVWGISGSKRTP